MKLPSLKAVAINAAVIGVIGAGGVTLVKSFFKPEVTVCTERYGKLVRMGVERNGQLMSASDIQAGVAGRDRGVMENLTPVRLDKAPMPSGFTVTMRAGSSQADNERGLPGGISFPWQPRALPANVTASCLSYSVFLPADFEFGEAGTLPGLYGVSPKEGLAKDERFTVHPVWGPQGSAASHSVLSTTEDWVTEVTSADAASRFPRGRWVRVDEEVVLNTPGRDDGRVRLWVDGVQRGVLPKANLRKSPDVTIQGVLVDVHFGGQIYEGRPTEGRALKDERIQLTPIELRWN